jgi:hypothetical protein
MKGRSRHQRRVPPALSLIPHPRPTLISISMLQRRHDCGNRVTGAGRQLSLFIVVPSALGGSGWFQRRCKLSDCKGPLQRSRR